MNPMKFWVLAPWPRILFQHTAEFKEYQEYSHGFSMDLQPQMGTPGSSTCTKATRRRWKDRRWHRSDLGMPIPNSRVLPEWEIRPRSDPAIGTNSQKNPTKRNSGLCKAPKPSWSSTQGAPPGFPTGKMMERTRGGRVERDRADFWEGEDFWEGIPALGRVCVRWVSTGMERIPLCYLWYWNSSSGKDGTDWMDSTGG